MVIACGVMLRNSVALQREEKYKLIEEENIVIAEVEEANSGDIVVAIEETPEPEPTPVVKQEPIVVAKAEQPKKAEVTYEAVIVETKPIVEESGENSNFTKPLRAGTVTSRYGTRNGRMHSGIDIAAPSGTNIYAAKAGEVIFCGWYGGYGNLVQIQHEDGYVTYYGHCSAFVTSVGSHVEQGDVIAKVGSTGNSTGPHVHFEIRVNGSTVNPYSYIY